MKKTFVAVCGVLALACGGGGSSGGGSQFKDPDQAHFAYQPAVAASIDEAGSANASVDAVLGGLTLADETDPAAAQTEAMSLAMAANDYADLFPGGSPLPLVRAGGPAALAAVATPSQLARAYSLDGPAFDDPNCWQLTASRATFNHCTVTSNDTSGSAVVSLDGSLSREIGHTAWDLAFAAKGTVIDPAGNVQIEFSDRLTGDLTWTTTSLDGFSRSDLWLSMSGQGQSLSGAVTFNADYAMDFDPGAQCVTGGTVTLKRLWSQVPNAPDADPNDFTDLSIRLAWPAGDPAGTCSDGLTIAWGTPQ